MPCPRLETNMTRTVTFTTERPVALPTAGLCTGTVTIDEGFPGSYWEPPEEGGIETIEVREAFGIMLPDEHFYEYHPEDLKALEAAVERDLQEQYKAEAEALAASYESCADFADQDIPF